MALSFAVLLGVLMYESYMGELTVWIVFPTVAICMYRLSPLVPSNSCLTAVASFSSACSIAVSRASDFALLVGYLCSLRGLLLYRIKLNERFRCNVVNLLYNVNMLVVTSTYLYTVIFIFHLPYMDVYLNLPISKIIHIYQGLLYHRTCKPDFLCSWPSLNSYLE